MSRRAAVVICVLCLSAGFVVGRSGKSSRAAPDVSAEPIAEISVSRPDPARPGEFLRERLRVTHSGTHASGGREQSAHDWSVTLWYPKPDDDTPQRSVHYFGVPVTAGR